MDKEIFFRVHIFFENSHRDLRPAPEYIIKWLRNCNFNVIEADFIDSFEVSFHIHNKEEEVEKRRILDKYLLSASIRNSMGFLITSSSDSPKYTSWVSVPPQNESLKKFIDACNNDDFLDTMNKLREFYAQVEQRSKIILGVSLLEELFNTKPKHILDKSEKEKILQVVEKFDWADDKKEKTMAVLRDTSFMATESRNKRIAREASKYLKEDEIKTLERINKIYKVRNSGAHTAEKKGQLESENALKEINVIFEMYLLYKFKFAKSAGMQFIE